MISPESYRRKHGLPPQGADLQFPTNARNKNMVRLSQLPAEYIAKFDEINGLKPVAYTCFNNKGEQNGN